MVDFTAIRAMLDRAESNLNALDEEVRDFDEADTKSTAIVDYYDPVDQTHSAVFKERTSIPQVKWGIRLGEIIHNMRCALDHLVTQLVLDAGHHVHSGHHFPIVTSKHEWNRQVVNPPLKSPPRLGCLDFVGPKYVAVIRGLQPYQSSAGLPSLLMLQQLWIAHLHGLIPATRVRLVDQPRIEVSAAFPVTLAGVTYANPGTTLEDGTEIARYDPEFSFLTRTASGEIIVSANAQMKVHVQLNTAIVFGDEEGERIGLGDIRSCLQDIRVAVIDRLAQGTARS